VPLPDSTCRGAGSPGPRVSPELARSLLLVEDDEVFRRRLARAFSERGWEVREAVDLVGALHAAEHDTPEFVVVDLRLPDGSGLEIVRRLKALDETTVIIVLTAYGSIATALDALRLGATHYLTKPADVDDLIAGFARPPLAAGDVRVASPDPIADTPSLARVEWEHINRVLADSGGNISEAARRLGLHRRSLQRKLAKYPVPR
jgi:two-component system, response regulator RegA